MTELIRYDGRTFGLPIYDQMRQLIVKARRLDEVADIRDKALACEYYANLAKDPQNERPACDVQLHDERRAGQLRELDEDTARRVAEECRARTAAIAAAAADASGDEVR